jgi:hypothetical protein
VWFKTISQIVSLLQLGLVITVCAAAPRWTYGSHPPNQGMKLSYCGGRLKGKGSILMAAVAPHATARALDND